MDELADRESVRPAVATPPSVSQRTTQDLTVVTDPTAATNELRADGRVGPETRFAPGKRRLTGGTFVLHTKFARDQRAA
jgi:hypothetical protein